MYRLQETKDKMQALGVFPQKSLGQNFLVSERVIETIVAAAQKTKLNRIVEVGPGLGAITEGLKALAPDLVVIELDRKFCEYWRTQEVRVIEGDALQIEWPLIFDKEPSLLVSNLPYQISSSIVIDRSVDPCGVQEMILMFQKEVAQRIESKPSTENYGMLSVMAQLFWKIEKVCDAGPKDFYPPPQVASRVLRFSFKNPFIATESKTAEAQSQQFLQFVKICFAHRRKMLVSNLKGYGEPGKAQEILNRWGIQDKIRPENLSPVQFLQLFREIKS